MRLTNEERETIITFDQTNAPANIYTCNPSWWRHFEAIGVEPIRLYGNYAREYEVPKEWIKSPRPPKRANLTPEQKKQLAARLQASRLRPKIPSSVT